MSITAAGGAVPGKMLQTHTFLISQRWINLGKGVPSVCKVKTPVYAVVVA